MKKEMSGVEREKNKTKDWRRRKRVEQNKQKKNKVMFILEQQQKKYCKIIP